MIAKQTAIVLNSRKFGDSSKIISVFTRDFGKISLIAKGSRNPKSKFGSSLEPLSWIEITFYKKSTTDLHLLSTADVIKPFYKLCTSLDHLSVALLILESISITHSDNQNNEELFDYVVGSFQQLNKLPANPFNLFIAAQFKLAETLGFYLHFDFMIDEVEDCSRNYIFSLEDGSPAVYLNNSKHNFTFSFDDALALQSIFRLPADDVTSVNISDSSQSQIVRFFSQYFGFHFERQFNYKSYSLMTV